MQWLQYSVDFPPSASVPPPWSSFERGMPQLWQYGPFGLNLSVSSPQLPVLLPSHRREVRLPTEPFAHTLTSLTSLLLRQDNKRFTTHLWLHKGLRGDNRQSCSSGQHP